MRKQEDRFLDYRVTELSRIVCIEDIISISVDLFTKKVELGVKQIE